MRLPSNVHPRSRALRAAVATVVESLEGRRLFAYSQVGAPIDNVYDGGSLDVVFDTGSITDVGDDLVLVGKPNEDADPAEEVNTNGTAELFDRSGASVQVFTNPDPDISSQFGYDVSIVGDRIAVSAFQGSGSVVYLFESDGSEVPGGPIVAPGGDFFQQIEDYGGDLLVRGMSQVFLYDGATGAALPFASPIVESATAMATDGSNILLATDNNTMVQEFSATGSVVRTITVDQAADGISLAYGPSSGNDVFVGLLNDAVYKFGSAGGSTGTATPLADSNTTGFALSLTVSGDYLLVGQVLDGAAVSASVYNANTGAFDSTIAAPDGSSAYFANVTAPIDGGFAIGDALADGGTGLIYFFERDTVAPTGPTAEVAGGTLTVEGTGDGESIGVAIVNGSVQVTVTSGNVTTLSASFPASSITGGIVINAGAGADAITSDSSNTFATEIHGGAGNDTITGGGGDDILFGEGDNDTLVARAGNDVAVGGEGSDAMSGGNGRDVLIGGNGTDDIEGENADDILVAGTTDHDANIANLQLIRTAWLAGTDYDTRVANLRGDLLAESKVHDDGVMDFLTGGNGQDWFLANDDDDILGALKNGEQVVEIV